ncbi:MAG: 23S rRNA (pseudouridine(1915)-N(3))-methyltransferase RlmH, partial [Alphaproteobacteria bacterium]|nr:23S rRNA (pseudouridine(1915)-N(3))-methyltransferase RlmH [Alphaproteobacteria bacterium]
MKLHIIARGKLGRGAEAEIIARYAKRISWPFAISELPDVGGKSPAALVPAIIVALDETGALLSSAELADKIVHWRDTGIRECRFLIGAADGLSDEARASADLLLSFGRA